MTGPTREKSSSMGPSWATALASTSL
jgi:hypothetical protein